MIQNHVRKKYTSSIPYQVDDSDTIKNIAVESFVLFSRMRGASGTLRSKTCSKSKLIFHSDINFIKAESIYSKLKEWSKGCGRKRKNAR